MADIEIEIPLIDLDGLKNIRLKEVFIKAGGEIWVFHKYDKDPSPSTPHGHNKETGEKLDVYTGERINPITGQIQGKLKDKILEKIQDDLRKKGFIEEQNGG